MTTFRSPDLHARARVLAFPHAGGGTLDYRALRSLLPAGLDLCPALLPGRELRFRETPRDDLLEYARALADELGPLVRAAPYLVYGHSMGSWLGFELVRELRRRRWPLPEALVVGARRAPHLPSTQSPLSSLSDPEFLAGLEARYGALPAAVRAEPELMRMILPVLRADFRALDHYRYQDEEPLPVRLVALGGRADPTVDLRELRAWQEHTLAGFELHLLEGGHFFHREAKAALVEQWARLLPLR